VDVQLRVLVIYLRDHVCALQDLSGHTLKVCTICGTDVIYGVWLIKNVQKRSGRFRNYFAQFMIKKEIIRIIVMSLKVFGGIIGSVPKLVKSVQDLLELF
jgi:hypothetical protein